MITERDRKRRKELYRERIQQGLCGRCGAPRDTTKSKSRCEACLQRARQYRHPGHHIQFRVPPELYQWMQQEIKCTGKTVGEIGIEALEMYQQFKSPAAK